MGCGASTPDAGAAVPQLQGSGGGGDIGGGGGGGGPAAPRAQARGESRPDGGGPASEGAHANRAAEQADAKEQGSRPHDMETEEVLAAASGRTPAEEAMQAGGLSPLSRKLIAETSDVVPVDGSVRGSGFFSRAMSVPAPQSLHTQIQNVSLKKGGLEPVRRKEMREGTRGRGRERKGLREEGREEGVRRGRVMGCVWGRDCEKEEKVIRVLIEL
jgi:hypothetical protein